MKTIKNILTLISFFILGIIGILFLFYEKMLLGTILIILVISGVIIWGYTKRKNIKTLSNSWINTNMFFLILTIILIILLRSFLFDKEIYLSEIVGGIIFLWAIYFYFKVIVPKYLMG